MIYENLKAREAKLLMERDLNQIERLNNWILDYSLVSPALSNVAAAPAGSPGGILELYVALGYWISGYTEEIR